MIKQLSLFSKLLAATGKSHLKPIKQVFELNSEISEEGIVEVDHKQWSLNNEKTYILCFCIEFRNNLIPVIEYPCLWEQVCEDIYRFRPDVNRSVQLSEQVIASNGKHTKFSVCTNEHYNKHLIELGFEPTDSWKTWIERGEELFYRCATYQYAQILKFLKDLPLSHLTLKVGIFEQENSDAIHLQSFYSYLTNLNELTLAKTPLRNAIDALEGNYQSVNIKQDKTHAFISENPGYLLGHMDESKKDENTDKPILQSRDLFALDNTQRTANYCISQLNDGDILAVNGPPGSGKTSMLKAVIASKYVSAAIEGKDCPITFAIGDTNQSVTNVISAFPNVAYQGKNKQIWHYKRWLPGVTNYGTFLPSKSKFKTLVDNNSVLDKMIAQPVTQNDCLALFEWKGSKSKGLTDFSAIENFKKAYIENASIYAKTSGFNDVKSVTKCLRNLLVKQYDEMCTTQKTLFNYRNRFDLLEQYFSVESIKANRDDAIDTIRKLKKLLTKDRAEVINEVARETIRDTKTETSDALKEQCQLTLIDRYLDLTYRVEMFHLAARYWEGIYLLEFEKEILITATEKNLEKALRRMCMLTPCLVSTLDSCAQFFKLYKDNIHLPPQYLLNKVDTLIIDETGQAQIGKGLPLLTLAKKVIAVGDVLQLQPVVTNITKQKEKDLFNAHGYSDAEYNKLQNRELLTTKGSLLHLLREASAFSDHDKGLLLRGHYRCQEMIIQLCNEMVYKNALFFSPHLSKKSDLFEPLLWVKSSEPGQPFDGSRINYDEADAIVKFILDKWENIYDHFEKDNLRIQDIIGFVSPYKHQPKIIKEKLTKAVKKASLTGKYEITDNDLEQLVSGTVNSLQGAEKPIIIFSSVKTAKDPGKLFFDEQPYLLNVALSRAKESFIAFLCPEEYGMIGNSDKRSETDNFVSYTGKYLKKNGKKLFPRHLVIIESPGKKKALELILGQDYEVIATKGQTYEQTKPVKINSAKNELRYRTKAESRILLQQIALKANDIDSVIIATDKDNAGEFIGFHLHQQLTKIQNQLNEKIRHVRLGAINEAEILKLIQDDAINQPQFCHIDSFTVNAEAGRELVDTFIAQRFNEIIHQNFTSDKNKISELIEKDIIAPSKSDSANAKAKQIGRVKAAILALISKGNIQRSTMSVKAKLIINNEIQKALDGVVVKGSKPIENQVNAISSKEYKADNSKWKEKIYKQETTFYQPPCSSTINIVRIAWERYNILPHKTMEYLQFLYEGDFKSD